MKQMAESLMCGVLFALFLGVASIGFLLLFKIIMVLVQEATEDFTRFKKWFNDKNSINKL